MDAGAQTGKREKGGCELYFSIFGADGHDELGKNRNILMIFPTNNKLALTRTYFSIRKGWIWHTHSGTRSHTGGKRI